MILEQLYKCHFWEIPQAALEHMHIVLSRGQILETAYGIKFEVTRGFSTPQEHIAIYKKINAERAAKGLHKVPVPIHSKHLIGAACDVADRSGDLKIWLNLYPHYLDDLDLWVESFKATPHHLHFQTQPYPSWKPGKSRFFDPF